MKKCPNCGESLGDSVKKCFYCGTSFKAILPEDSKTINYKNSDNIIAKLMRIFGFVIIILGTILSFFIADKGEHKYEFSFICFIISESVSIISGLFFIGFSEIIQLLEDIKNKLN